jgi:8-oxo-dGTP pyrophosphatase MutT (NUDIX family)
MQMDDPVPGATVSDQTAAAVPRPAATVILLRGGATDLEVLLVRRNPQAQFLGGAWVFPGGTVKRGEGDGEAALRAAACRELAEEAGITIARPNELVPFARWITPVQAVTRFDTWFFLAPAPNAATATVDGSEIVDARWYVPADALAASARDELFLVFPTIKQLEQLSRFPSAHALLEHARGREITPIQPRVVRTGEAARILLPGDPGYAEPEPSRPEG